MRRSTDIRYNEVNGSYLQTGSVEIGKRYHFDLTASSSEFDDGVLKRSDRGAQLGAPLCLRNEALINMCSLITVPQGTRCITRSLVVKVHPECYPCGVIVYEKSQMC